MRHAVVSLALGVCFLVAGCGGGGSDSPRTVALQGEPDLEGSIWAVAGGPAGVDLFVGDQQSQVLAQGIRGFLSFDLSGIPPGAIVQQATLRVVQSLVVAAPYDMLGNLYVDEVVYGDTLESGAYDRSYPLNQGLGPISQDATLGPKTLDVTAAVQDDLSAPRAHAQFRLRFTVETNGDTMNDQVKFWSSDTAMSAADRPTLVVTYRP